MDMLGRQVRASMSTWVLLACSCQAPLPVAPDRRRAGTASEEPLLTSPQVRVESRASPPAELVIDGELREWSLDAAEDSRVTIALTAAGLAMAGELRGPSRRGIWLGIGFIAPDLTPLGLGFRQADGTFVSLDCNAAFAAPDCVEKIAAREAFAAEYQTRFHRVFRIDEQGVRVARGDRLEPVPGAKSAFRLEGALAVAEGLLPLSALPHASASPIDMVLLDAVAVSEHLQTPSEAKPWSLVIVPELTIEPYGPLRDRMFREGLPFLSYQPGDPLHLAQVGYVDEVEAYALRDDEGPVCHAVAKVDALEFCLVTLGESWLAVLDGTRVLGVHAIGREPSGHALRGHELHMFTLDQSRYAFESMPDGRVISHYKWRVTIARADGTVQEVSLQADDEQWWVEAEPFNSPDYRSFGLRGAVRSALDPAKVDSLIVTWTLTADGSYDLKSQRTPAR